MAGERPKVGVLDAVLVAVPLLALLAVRTFAGPCVHDDGTAAMCQPAGDGILWLSIAAVVVALVRLFVPGKAGKIALAATVAVLGIAIALVPGVIMPLCMMETMHCQAVMKPVAMVLGIVMAVVGCACAAMSARSPKASRRPDAGHEAHEAHGPHEGHAGHGACEPHGPHDAGDPHASSGEQDR